MKVLRIAHHAVVSAWRERERMLRARGARLALLSAKRWNEGGRVVALDPDADDFVRGVATVGTHPNAFLYDPRPIWRALGATPDLLDLHEEPFALATAEILALRALRRSRVPYLLYSAQNLDKRYPIPFRWFESYALRHAAGAYVCNAEAGRILTRKGLRGPARLIPLGVDVEQFAPAVRAEPGTRPTIGYVGRLEPHKGVATLLRAAVPETSWRVRITGEGSEEARLRALAEELGIADRVEFLGFAEGDDLAARYRDLDVIAVPSIPWPGWLEQFCRVAVEAMASGVPVVASSSGAIPDVVADAGVLVAPGEPDALRRGIRQALDDRNALRVRGLERSRAFTWDRVAQQQWDLYREVVPARDVDLEGVPARGSGAERAPQVVLVAYGSSDMLRGALETLGAGFPITIVDNSSSSETAALAAEHAAHYIDPGANLGFGAGVNVALRSLADRGVADDDVLLLNPDARIAAAGVERMRRVLHADRRLAVVGATQVQPETGETVRVWWPFPSPARAWTEALGLGAANRAHGFAIGSILLLRAEAVRHVGLFDERFFLYAEEVDWQKRATDAGWRIDVADADASHIGAATSNDSGLRELLFHASAEHYQRKHFGAVGWQLFRAAMVTGAAIRVVALRGERRSAAASRLRLFLRGPVASLADAQRGT